MLLLVSAIVQQPAAASGNNQASDGLFLPVAKTAASASSVASIQARDGVIRSRFVGIKANGISSSTTSLKLNLFDDVVLTAIQTRVERIDAIPGSYTWIGYVDGKTYSEVILTVNDDIVAGHVLLEDGLYEVSYAGNSVHAVIQLDPQATKDEHIHIQVPMSSAAMQPMGDSGAVIDVMILYTTAARTAAGSANAMLTQIASAVASTNQAYANTQMNQRIRLVYAGEIAYTESGTQVTDLQNLTTPNDGKLDLAQNLRNMYRADLVTLITASNTNSGVAWIMQNLNAGFAPHGYNVVGRNALSYTVLAHEMGHNMGEAHDYNNSCGALQSGCPGVYPYSYGYQDPTGAFRDIMAYPNGCKSPCPTVNYFSNQTILYGGKPMGHATADNRTSMNNTASTVANFRQSLRDSIGVYHPSNRTFYLRNSNSGGAADITVTLPSYLPTTGIYPVVGDWNGDGTDTVGFFNQALGIFALYDTNSTGAPVTQQFVLGNPGDTPLAGRWVSDAGHDGVGVFRPSNGLIYLASTWPPLNTAIYADYVIVLGNPGWMGLAGKWTVGALDTAAVYDPSNGHFYMTSLSCNGTPPGPNVVCNQFSNNDTYFGTPNSIPIRGDWADLSQDGIGSYDPSTGAFTLKNVFPAGTGTTSAANTTFAFGSAGDIPLSGHWIPGNVTGNSIIEQAPITQPAIIVGGTAEPKPTEPTTPDGRFD